MADPTPVTIKSIKRLMESSLNPKSIWRLATESHVLESDSCSDAFPEVEKNKTRLKINETRMAPMEMAALRPLERWVRSVIPTAAINGRNKMNQGKVSFMKG